MIKGTRSVEPINLTELEVRVDGLFGLLDIAYTEALTEAFDEYPFYLYFTSSYSDEPVDPLQVTVDTAALTRDSDESIEWTFDLRAAALDAVDSEEDATRSHALSAALRDLADQIDARIKANEAAP